MTSKTSRRLRNLPHPLTRWPSQFLLTCLEWAHHLLNYMQLNTKLAIRQMHPKPNVKDEPIQVYHYSLTNLYRYSTGSTCCCIISIWVLQIEMTAVAATWGGHNKYPLGGNTIRRTFCWTAMCSGQRPLASIRLTLAPLPSSVSTTASCPSRAASVSGVSPDSKHRLRLKRFVSDRTSPTSYSLIARRKRFSCGGRTDAHPPMSAATEVTSSVILFSGIPKIHKELTLR